MKRVILALAMVLAPLSAQAQTFDNAAVIALTKAGLGKDVLLAKIGSLPCNYNTSPDQLVALKQAHVEDAVIAAMVKACAGSNRAQGVDDASADPRVMHRPGIYLAEGNRLRILRPSLTSGVKVTGNGSLLLPYTVKGLVPQSTSAMQVASAVPTFWFYFKPHEGRDDDFGDVASVNAQSPAEFSLVPLKKDGAMRQFLAGKAQPFMASAGIDAKYAVPFASYEEGDGIFRVEMSRPLGMGDYAFVLPGSRGRNNNYRIYDFAVTTGK